MTLESTAPVSVEITNSSGSSVQKLEFTPDGLSINQNISLKELPVGAYIVTARSNGKTWIRKITKE